MEHLFVYFAAITVISAAVPQDLCDTCVRTQDCPLFENLNVTDQLKWMERFPCGPRKKDDIRVPAGFASAAVGDYVCCSNNIWGVEKSNNFGSYKNKQPWTNSRISDKDSYLNDDIGSNKNNYNNKNPKDRHNNKYNYYDGSNNHLSNNDGNNNYNRSRTQNKNDENFDTSNHNLDDYNSNTINDNELRPKNNGSTTVWYPDRSQNYDNTNYWLTHGPEKDDKKHWNDWPDNPSEEGTDVPVRNNPPSNIVWRPTQNDPPENEVRPPSHNDLPADEVRPPILSDPPENEANRPVKKFPPPIIIRPPIQFDPSWIIGSPPYSSGIFKGGFPVTPPIENIPPEDDIAKPTENDGPEISMRPSDQYYPPRNFRPPNENYYPRNFRPPNENYYPGNYRPRHRNTYPENYRPPYESYSPGYFGTPKENYYPGNLKPPNENYSPGDFGTPRESYTPGNFRPPHENYSPGNFRPPDENYSPGNYRPPNENYSPGHIRPPNEDYSPGHIRPPNEDYSPGHIRPPKEDYSPGHIRPPNEDYSPGHIRPPNEDYSPGHIRPPKEDYSPGHIRPPKEDYSPGNFRPPNEYYSPGNYRPPNENYTPGNFRPPNENYSPGNSRPPYDNYPPATYEPPNENPATFGPPTETYYPGNFGSPYQYHPPRNFRPPNHHYYPRNSGSTNNYFPPEKINYSPINYPPNDNYNFMPGPPYTNNFPDDDQRNRRYDNYDYNNNYPYYSGSPYNIYGQDKHLGNFGGGQCKLTSFPPDPQSGCCGRQLADDDRITDSYYNKPAFNNNNNNKWGSRPRSGPVWRTKRFISENDTEVTIENRISGGHATDFYQFPWTVLLLTTFDYGRREAAFNCGGGLISAKYVLTAGHCVYDKGASVKSVQVNLAEFDKSTFPNDCKTSASGRHCIENLVMYAEEIIAHPQYENENLVNDIALLRLRGTAPYTEYIRPICLPSNNIDEPQFANVQFDVAGWGRVGPYSSNIKQFTSLNLVAHEQCRKYYPQLTNKHLCAAGKRGEDTCKGDSGGPLMIAYRGRYYVAGIVSGKRADSPCGTAVPSLYTNVYNYVDWIHNVIKN